MPLYHIPRTIWNVECNLLIHSMFRDLLTQRYNARNGKYHVSIHCPILPLCCKINIIFPHCSLHLLFVCAWQLPDLYQIMINCFDIFPPHFPDHNFFLLTWKLHWRQTEFSPHSWHYFHVLHACELIWHFSKLLPTLLDICQIHRSKDVIGI